MELNNISPLEAQKRWLSMKPRLPKNRQSMWREAIFCTVLMVEEPITAEDEELNAAVEAFELGEKSFENPDVRVKWQLSRLPYHVEVNVSGSLQGTIFIDVFKWQRFGENEGCQKSMQHLLKMQKQLTGGLTIDAKDPMYALLVKIQTDKQKDGREAVLRYLDFKKISKMNIESADLAISQILADAYNVGIIPPGVLALTWGEYNHIIKEEKNETATTGKIVKNKRKKNKKKSKKKVPSSSATDMASEDVTGIESGSEGEIGSVITGRDDGAATRKTFEDILDPALDISEAILSTERAAKLEYSNKENTTDKETIEEGMTAAEVLPYHDEQPRASSEATSVDPTTSEVVTEGVSHSSNCEGNSTSPGADAASIQAKNISSPDVGVLDNPLQLSPANKEQDLFDWTVAKYRHQRRRRPQLNSSVDSPTLQKQIASSQSFVSSQPTATTTIATMDSNTPSGADFPALNASGSKQSRSTPRQTKAAWSSKAAEPSTNLANQPQRATFTTQEAENLTAETGYLVKFVDDSRSMRKHQQRARGKSSKSQLSKENSQDIKPTGDFSVITRPKKAATASNDEAVEVPARPLLSYSQAVSRSSPAPIPGPTNMEAFPLLMPVTTIPGNIAIANAKAIRKDSISKIQEATQRRSIASASNSEHLLISEGGNAVGIDHDSQEGSAAQNLSDSSQPTTTTTKRVVFHDPIAMPDARLLFKGKMKQEASTNRDGAKIEASRRQTVGTASLSRLRGEAPIFELPSQQTSTLTSPDLVGWSSVPMSASTSLTSNISILNSNSMFDISVFNNIKRCDSTVDQAHSESSKARTTNAHTGKQGAPSNRPSQAKSLAPTIMITSHDEDEDEDVEKLKLKPEERYKLEVWTTYPPFDDDAKSYNLGLNNGPPPIRETNGSMTNHFLSAIAKLTIRPFVSAQQKIPRTIGAVIMETESGCKIATAQFDRENNVIRIYPASKVMLPDPRTTETHSDHLPAMQLKVVQSLEYWGFLTYRSNRIYHKCHREGCDKMAGDDDSSDTWACYGCGPMSPVRYCGPHCSFEDMPAHYKDCGTAKFWPPSHWARDEHSFSAWANNIYPFILDVNGFKSYERHRIAMVALTQHGQYAIFPEHGDRLAESFVVQWNSNAPLDIRDRFVRLLNCAMFNRTLRPIIIYMYLLVRDALYEQIESNDGELPTVLYFQIKNEWDFNWKETTGLVRYLKSIKTCECMWLGTDKSPECAGGCPAGYGIESEYKKQGLRVLVEKLEKENWILRAWRYLHPNVSDWRDRLIGKGFHGVKLKHVKDFLPVLGVGYNGYIDKDRRVGDWRPRLKLTTDNPPKVLEVAGGVYQSDEGFFWVEPESEGGRVEEVEGEALASSS